MQYLVNGAQFDISTVRGLAVAISAITNGNPPVATATTAPDDGSVVVVSSGWAGIDGRPFLSGGKSGNSFQLTGMNTTNQQMYFPGAGAGLYAAMSGWTPITQITGIDQTGGEQNAAEWNYVNDPTGEGQSMPTNKTPLVLTFTMHYDPDLPWYNALIAIDEAKAPIVVRERLPSGRQNLFAGFMSFQKFATRTPNEIQTVTGVLRVNKSTPYSAIVQGS